jgi:hypothetical protein
MNKHGAGFPSLFLSCLFLLAGLGQPSLSAEELWSSSGFFVDMPEGFSLVDGDGASRFAFQSPDGGMDFYILRYEAARHPSAESLAAESLKKLGSSGEREAFRYEGRDAVFAELRFSLNGEKQSGYGIFIKGRAAPGSGGQSRGSLGGQSPAAPAAEPSFALLAWTTEADFEAYADFILSCLDSFSIDRAAKRSPGPLSQYLLPWPATRAETRSFSFGGQSLTVPWSPEEASQVADTAFREMKVLEAYGDEPELWQAAWARCYRMIYRESARRLDQISLEIGRLLPEDPTSAARSMLQWVQGWTYDRGKAELDFIDPLTAVVEGRGDCDSRALVMAIVLERQGIDSLLMLSREYSHAMAAVDVPGGGQRFPWADREWLVAETTDKVGIGLIAKKQADWKKWIGVEFGD